MPPSNLSICRINRIDSVYFIDNMIFMQDSGCSTSGCLETLSWSCSLRRAVQPVNCETGICDHRI